MWLNAVLLSMVYCNLRMNETNDAIAVVATKISGGFCKKNLRELLKYASIKLLQFILKIEDLLT